MAFFTDAHLPKTWSLRRLKINPLAYWDLKDVWKYIEEHHATLIDSHTIHGTGSILPRFAVYNQPNVGKYYTKHGWYCMGLAWMIIVCAVFFVFVCMCICAPLVSFGGSPSPQFGIFDRGHWQVCLSNGIRTNIQGFLSRKMFFFVVEYWVYCTFVKLKCENFMKKIQIMFPPAKLGTGEMTKIMLIKYTVPQLSMVSMGKVRFCFGRFHVLGIRSSFAVVMLQTILKVFGSPCQKGLGILTKSWKLLKNRDRMIEIFMNRVCFLGTVTIP